MTHNPNMCKPTRPLWERWPTHHDQESIACMVDRRRYIAALTPEQRQMRLDRADWMGGQWMATSRP